MQTRISFWVSNPSSLVTPSDEIPLMRIAYCSTAKSSQPHRRGRPVTAPYSFPRSRTSVASRSGISVGNGPLPTRVVYAFVTPATALIRVGPTPRPVQAPPEIAFEDVTNG